MAVAGLIVGLGNPGKQYESTRHNMGFLFVDELLREAKNVSSMSGDKFRCELWKAALPGSPDQWLIAKPQTFMNLSGECVQPLAAWHRLLPENILVVHDELDIAPGRMKFKKGGGNAGHNGLKSITQRLGTPDFYRLRLGIGCWIVLGTRDGIRHTWNLVKVDGTFLYVDCTAGDTGAEKEQSFLFTKEQMDANGYIMDDNFIIPEI